MKSIFARQKLRPTRIGFLVRPADKTSIVKIAEVNSCLWGGASNPIIPFFKRSAKYWKKDHPGNNNLDVAREYIKFFEPDVIVESELGLLNEIGMNFFSKERTTTLDQFWNKKRQPKFGLKIDQYYQSVFNAGRKFALRDGFEENHLYLSDPNDGLNGSVIFGHFPRVGNSYLLKAQYDHVYQPKLFSSFSEAWDYKYLGFSKTPLSISDENLDSYHRNNGVKIYIYDPKSSYDLIDFWNIRVQFGDWVIPVPTSIFAKGYSRIQNLIDNLIEKDIAIDVEFGRSLNANLIQNSLNANISNPTNFPISYKFWRSRIWEGYNPEHFVSQPQPANSFEEEKFVEVHTSNNDYVSLQSFTPAFIQHSGDNKYSWMNVLRLRDQYHEHGLTTTLPFSLNSGIRWNVDLACDAKIAAEGWCFPFQYKSTRISLKKTTVLECLEKYFGQTGLDVRRSESGKISFQIFESFKQATLGMIGTAFLANEDRLRFMNRFAMSKRERSNVSSSSEEVFPSKSIKLSDLKEHVGRSSISGLTIESVLERFTKYQILQVGVGVKCSNCFTENWYDLDSIGYEIICQFCRKTFNFPEHTLNTGERDWRYKLIGPFSTPDFARGSYSTILTARFLDQLTEYDDQLAFDTGLLLTNQNENYEADLVGWLREKGRYQHDLNPRLFFSECKSFGELDIIKTKDIDRMSQLAKRFPDAVLIFSVLKPELSGQEKRKLQSFIQKFSNESKKTRKYRPILILTGKDLFFETRLNFDRLGDYSTRTLTHLAKKLHELNL